MVAKQVRAAYTQEFRLEAVRLVQSGQSQMQVCQMLGIPKASLGSWVRQVKAGKLQPGVTDGASKVTPEQMELARLRAENARLRMERDIAKKAAAYFAQDVLRGMPGLSK
jgi:transposase